MPYKEREINKMYYSMGEVTQMFGVNASQIRFYEKEFDVLQPKKNKKGNRLFTPADIENLKKLGVTPIAHLSCISSTKADIKEKLTELKEKGVENINFRYLDLRSRVQYRNISGRFDDGL